MENLSHTIVDKAVTTELQKGNKSVEGLTDAVQEKVKADTEELQEEFGDAAKDLCADAMAEAKSYADERKEMLSGFDVEDLSSKGAAGLCEMDSKRVVIDEKYLENDDANLAEAEKIAAHERRHQEQAATFDRDSITLEGGETIEAIDLYEGDAITAAGQTSAELTPDYVVHKEKFDKVAAEVGRGTVEDAIKKGTISEIQVALAA